MYLPKLWITQGNFAPVNAGYLVTALTGTLSHERVLATGTNIIFNDAGPGGAFTISVTGVVGSEPVDTGSLAPKNPQYLTLASHAGLDNERVFTLGDNLVAVDNGAGGTYILSVTGVTTGVIPNTGLLAPSNAEYLALSTHGGLVNERRLVMGLNLVATDGGAGGDYTISVTGVATGTIPNTGLLAPSNAEYLTLSTHGGLLNERRFMLGMNLIATDGGAGGDYTISVTGVATGVIPNTGSLAPNTAEYLVLTTHAALANERQLTLGANLTSIDGGAGGTYTISVTGVATGVIPNTGLLAPNNASYLLIGSHGALGTARQLALGNNLVGVDGGAGGTYTISVTGVATGVQTGNGITFGEALRLSMLGL